jgi:predicted nucleotide-binding protein
MPLTSKSSVSEIETHESVGQAQLAAFARENMIIWLVNVCREGLSVLAWLENRTPKIGQLLHAC